MDAAPAPLDTAAVTTWLVGHVELSAPLRFDQVAGGKSNLTFVVTDAAGRKAVLRRPPTGEVAATAHDVGREHRIMAALEGGPVPVPRQLAWCDDLAVTGAPFVVMEHVDGVVLRSPDDARALLPEDRRRAAAEALVDTLVAIHGVDVDAVGLGELGRRSGYLLRQLRRWRGQFELSRQVTGRSPAVVDEVHDLLVDKVPAERPATLVHGDYRFDNVLLGPGGEVRAVLDWELSTLGDPLADVGVLLVYWGDRTGRDLPLGSPPTLLAGFPSSDWVATRYAERAGVDLGELDAYVAFAMWKLACICDGVNARAQLGAMGDAADDLAVSDETVDELLLRARDLARSL